MSRTIDPDRIASGDLTEDEVLYLQQRDQLPSDYERVDMNLHKAPLLTDVTHTGTVNSAGETIEQLEARLERMKAEQAGNPAVKSFGKDQQELAEVHGQEAPVFVEQDPDGDEDDVDEDAEPETYTEGWSNDTRRAELQRRGLDTSGNKEELIARLLADDEANAAEDDEDEE